MTQAALTLPESSTDNERISVVESIPFALVHIFALGGLFTGFKTIDIAVCVGLYVLRMFFITAGYHRYFAHRSYKLGRFSQFLMAVGGASAAQKGPLWWAGLHRHHHRTSDSPEDIHSPKRGFWWSHVGWILCSRYKDTPTHEIEDYAKFPELRFVDRFYVIVPTLLGIATYLFGGWSMLFTGFFLSTVLLYHGTFFINSLAHVYGSRRYATRDTSRNNFLLALITLGEGWHNNHHHYQGSVRQGFFWWEVDVSYYVVRTLAFVGLASDLKQPPLSLLAKNQIKDGSFDVGMFEAYLAKATATLDSARSQVAANCEAQIAAMRLLVEDARSKGEETWTQFRESARESCEIRRKDYETRLEHLLEAVEARIDEARSQTREFCEQKARSLDRTVTFMKVNASDYYESRRVALEEISASIRLSAEEFGESIAALRAELTDCLEDLRARPAIA